MLWPIEIVTFYRFFGEFLKSQNLYNLWYLNATISERYKPGGLKKLDLIYVIVVMLFFLLQV